MKYPPIDKRLFIKNRKDFVDKMKPNSVAIFLSNDIMPTNADGTMPFVQNTNLLYLSGIPHTKVASSEIIDKVVEMVEKKVQEIN